MVSKSKKMGSREERNWPASHGKGLVLKDQSLAPPFRAHLLPILRPILPSALPAASLHLPSLLHPPQGLAARPNGLERTRKSRRVPPLRSYFVWTSQTLGGRTSGCAPLGR